MWNDRVQPSSPGQTDSLGVSIPCPRHPPALLPDGTRLFGSRCKRRAAPAAQGRPGSKWAQLKSSSLLEIDANRSIRVAPWTMVATSCDHLSNLFPVLLALALGPFQHILGRCCILLRVTGRKRCLMYQALLSLMLPWSVGNLNLEV